MLPKINIDEPFTTQLEWNRNRENECYWALQNWQRNRSQITWQLVLKCAQCLFNTATCNIVIIIWRPGNTDFEANDKAVYRVNNSGPSGKALQNKNKENWWLSNHPSHLEKQTGLWPHNRPLQYKETSAYNGRFQERHLSTELGRGRNNLSCYIWNRSTETLETKPGRAEQSRR